MYKEKNEFLQMRWKDGQGMTGFCPFPCLSQLLQQPTSIKVQVTGHTKSPEWHRTQTGGQNKSCRWCRFPDLGKATILPSPATYRQVLMKARLLPLSFLPFEAIWTLVFKEYNKVHLWGTGSIPWHFKSNGCHRILYPSHRIWSKGDI